MDPRLLVGERARLVVSLVLSAEYTEHATPAQHSTGLWLPYEVRTLHNEPFKARRGGAAIPLWVHCRADNFPLEFGGHDPQTGETLFRWLVQTAAKQIDPFVKSTSWYLRASLTGPAVTKDEYFTARVTPQRGPSSKFMDPIVFADSFKVDSSVYLHWSEFFEEGDPNRRAIHDAYKSCRKAMA